MNLAGTFGYEREQHHPVAGVPHAAFPLSMESVEAVAAKGCVQIELIATGYRSVCTTFHSKMIISSSTGSPKF